MKIMLGLVVAAGLASSALADGPNNNNPNWGNINSGMQALDESQQGTFGDAVSTRYDNHTNPNAALTGSLAVGLGVEWADDLTLVPVAGSNQITQVGWNAVNANTTAAVTASTMIVRFYDSLGNLILTNDGFGGIQFTQGNIAANASVRFTSAVLPLANAWTIPAASANFVYMSTTWGSATIASGGTAANLSFGLRGPINVGSSADIIYNITAGTSGNFGGAPLANFGLKVLTDVPAPASLALLGMGGLIAGRRRRA